MSDRYKTVTFPVGVGHGKALARYAHLVSKYGVRSMEATYVRLLHLDDELFGELADGIDRLHERLSRRKGKK